MSFWRAKPLSINSDTKSSFRGNKVKPLPANSLSMISCRTGCCNITRRTRFVWFCQPADGQASGRAPREAVERDGEQWHRTILVTRLDCENYNPVFTRPKTVSFASRSKKFETVLPNTENLAPTRSRSAGLPGVLLAPRAQIHSLPRLRSPADGVSSEAGYTTLRGWFGDMRLRTDGTIWNHRWIYGDWPNW